MLFRVFPPVFLSLWNRIASGNSSSSRGSLGGWEAQPVLRRMGRSLLLCFVSVELDSSFLTISALPPDALWSSCRFPVEAVEGKAGVPCQVFRLAFAQQTWSLLLSERMAWGFFLQQPAWNVGQEIWDPSFCKSKSWAGSGTSLNRYKACGRGSNHVLFWTSRIPGTAFNSRTLGFTALMCAFNF